MTFKAQQFKGPSSIFFSVYEHRANAGGLVHFVSVVTSCSCIFIHFIYIPFQLN